MHDLRVLTLNCWNGRADPDSIARFLEERSVDVACLQELDPRQAGAIQEVLPHGKLEPCTDHSGMGIAARFATEVHRVSLPRRDARVAELTTDAWPQLPAPLQLLNVHIQAPHIRPWASLPLRRAQVSELTDWLAQHRGERCVLVGDLNSTPLWPAYRRLTTELADGVLDLARSEYRGAKRTWGPIPGAPRFLRIDHVLTAGVRLQGCEVLQGFGSDHSGVVADLELEEELLQTRKSS
jgi:endonuclease/exonuclease/phosphatase family metal-dependent hydrolase